jgi:hypothetical protein
MTIDERYIKAAMARLTWTVILWNTVITILLAAVLVLVKR